MRFLLSAVAALLVASATFAGEFTRTEDVIYGRKFGLAMTMDVFEPKENKNGLGVIFCVSGGWVSSKLGINLNFIRPLTDRGYVVFAVVHGSQPRFTIPEVLDDMHRATRFVKHNAKKWVVDPERLGITGGSAGGHLSLMQGNAFKPAVAEASDPLDRQSSRVASIGCFFPPTDFLNYGESGNINLGTGTLKGFRPPFDFWERNKDTNSLTVITDEVKRKAIGIAVSPVYHVTKDAAPALVIHGDKDKLVPIQQAELMKAAYDKAGAQFTLVVKKDGDHGWAGIDKDIAQFADWFDKTLKK